MRMILCAKSSGPHVPGSVRRNCECGQEIWVAPSTFVLMLPGDKLACPDCVNLDEVDIQPLTEMQKKELRDYERQRAKETD